MANPFSEERRRLDWAVGQRPAGTPWSESVDASILRLKSRLEELPSSHLGDYGSAERRLLELAILFDVFHDYGPEMDALVQRQLETGEEALEVPLMRCCGD